MKFTWLLAAVAATSLASVSAADAAARHKRHKEVVYPPARAYAAPAFVAQPRRPAWASPYECYTDEGYGRFWPCGAGKDQ
jgi:hypothetical protein